MMTSSGEVSDSDVQFSDRRYGKNYVRLLHVRRRGTVHDVTELEVNVALTLKATDDYVDGDNTDIVATDSMKNTVYVLAKLHGIDTIEGFGLLLTEHFINKYNQVKVARVYIEQPSWTRIVKDNKEHVHAYLGNSECKRFCHVELRRDETAQVWSGIKDLMLLKTTQSAFKNFVRDEFRSLPDSSDRIFCTRVYAKWQYATTSEVNFDDNWASVKAAILDTFAGPPDVGLFSPSVQKTMYDAQKLALGKVPQISEIEIVLPNIHYYEFDFSKLPQTGITKNKEIFHPTDKPSGNICLTLQRRQLLAKL